MADTNTASSGGVGFCGLLTILFIALKLTGYIGWTWLWVLSPLWLPIVVVLSIIVLIFLGATILQVLK